MFAQIRNLGVGGRTCLDSPARKKDLKKAVGLYPCHNQGGNQVNKENLMNRSRCSEGYRPKHVCEKTNRQNRAAYEAANAENSKKKEIHSNNPNPKYARPFICLSSSVSVLPLLFYTFYDSLKFFYFVRDSNIHTQTLGAQKEFQNKNLSF